MYSGGTAPPTSRTRAPPSLTAATNVSFAVYLVIDSVAVKHILDYGLDDLGAVRPLESLAHSPGRGDVVVLDKDGVKQSQAVVDGSSGASGQLFRR